MSKINTPRSTMSNLNLTPKLCDREDKVYTVTRGELCLRVEEKWEEIKDIAERGDLDELSDFVLNLKDSGNYSGILFTNTFRVNQPVSLVSVGFFGPHGQQKAMYKVFIEMDEFKTGKVVNKTVLTGVEGRCGKIFQARFKHPVSIKPYVYYNIKFQLDGPDTGICDHLSLKRECYTSDGATCFEFFNGSLQMPDISFVIH